MNDDSFLHFVIDQLRGLESVIHRPMFGGHGLYQGAAFFGIVFDGRLYFKTDDRTRSRYEEYGMESFRPNDKQTLKTYYEVPVDVSENHRQLTEWAKEAVACQRNG